MMRDTGVGVVVKPFIHMWKIGCSNPGCDKAKFPLPSARQHVRISRVQGDGF